MTAAPDRTFIPTNRTGRLVLTVTEAAELLGISRAFAYELVARGELPAIRLGRRVVVPRARLLALVGEDPTVTGSDGRDLTGPAAHDPLRLSSEPLQHQLLRRQPLQRLCA